MNIIKCDDTTSIVVKWEPMDKNGTICMRDILRVKQGQGAVFVHKDINGKYQDIVYGPYDKPLEISNFPTLSKIKDFILGKKSLLNVDIYFVNVAKLIQIGFGVPYFDVFDNVYNEFSVPIAIRGTINFKVLNINEFITIHGLNYLSIDDFKNKIMSKLTRYIKDVIINLPEVGNISCVKLESQISKVSDILQIVLNEKLRDELGVEVSSLDLDAIEVDKGSDDYKDYIKVTKKKTLKTIIQNSRRKRTKEDVEVINDVLDVATRIINILKFNSKVK